MLSDLTNLIVRRVVGSKEIIKEISDNMFHLDLVGRSKAQVIQKLGNGIPNSSFRGTFVEIGSIAIALR